jgi:NADPH:quinone reductase-like Zn-dependent oxidoreductase
VKSYHLGAGRDEERLVLREHDVPEPGPGQALVRVRASALSYRETMILEDRYGLPVAEDTVPLCDGAGEVEAVGEGTTLVRPGDRVSAVVFPLWQDGRFDWAYAPQLGSSLDGMLTEYAVLDETALVRIPATLSFVEAAALPLCGLTAWNALTGGRPVRAGESVLVLGSGAVSLFALQFAKLAGARVIATTSCEDKAVRLKAMGADAVINYREDPDWPAAVRRAADGRGVDHAVEVVGRLGETLRALAPEGEMGYVGFWLAGEGAQPLDPAALFFSNCRIRCVAVGSRAQQASMNDAVERSGLKPVVDRVFGFDEAREAFRYHRSGRFFGQVVIDHG